MNEFDYAVKYLLNSIMCIFFGILLYKIFDNYNLIFEWFTGNHWSFIDGIVTLATLFFVFRNWLNNRKQNDTVKIVLFQNAKRYELDLYILRKNFTRAEVKGILRELNESQIFEIDYISNPKSTFLKDIYEIQSGKKDSLIIDILISDNFKLKGNQ